MRLDLTSHLKIHFVVHVLPETPYKDQPVDITLHLPVYPHSVPIPKGKQQFVERIWKYRNRVRGYQFLAFIKRAPTHKAERQSIRDIVDRVGNVTEIELFYIAEMD